MSRWQIATAILALQGGLLVQASAQDKSAPADQDAAAVAAQNGLPPPFTPPPTTSAPTPSEMPPEEDTGSAPKVYSFNPVQSQHEVMAGDFYFKKGNFTAAVNRFLEATKWNDGNAEAWMRLGEAQEKRSNARAAREAYQKYLELAPDAKNAAEIKKRLTKLKG